MTSCPVCKHKYDCTCPASWLPRSKQIHAYAEGLEKQVSGRLESLVEKFEDLYEGANADKPYYATDSYDNYPFGLGWGIF